MPGRKIPLQKGTPVTYRILIVEDTPAEADRLRMHLERYAKEKDLTFSIRVLPSATEFLSVHPAADLIFMDIGMPGITGMEAAEALRGYDEETPLIFVTTLAQYAVQGYRVDALDFLVKPVEYGEFVPRMNRALRVMSRHEGTTIALPAADGTRVVRLADILYIDIVKHDLQYHIAGEAEPLRNRGSITQAVRDLGGKGFLKISASCVVNMGQVARIKAQSVVMSDGMELWFSRSQRKHALEELSKYVGRSI